jgi:regulator of sigma E protease
MGEVLGSIWWLLVALGLLITFHEFGHFWVARKLGVRVLRFSVGFGKALWTRRGADHTEYVIAVVPLGGYVKMLDEREGEVPPDELDQAFNRKPVWARIAIVAAGPVFNLAFRNPGLSSAA